MKYAFFALLAIGLVTSVNAEWKPAESPLMTPWGEKVTPENAYREYPRPQLQRADWTNLNGLWDYAVTDKATFTIARPAKWDGQILVPYAIESALSGVGRKLRPDQFLWYRRTITCSPRQGERILLHFGAVDFRAQVFIGHNEVTDVPHSGGLVPFTLDITPFVKRGENELVVCVWDPTTQFVGATGKQVFEPGGCMYTRVSGIWQTVWMETVPERYIERTCVTADIAKGIATLKLNVVGKDEARTVRIPLKAGHPNVQIGDFAVTHDMPAKFTCWSPKNPQLYHFTATCGSDSVKGYFAMRSFERRRDPAGIWRFYLNGEPCFLQGPLDQGWWPESLLTPPSAEAMKFDIQFLKDIGFNMMRKHIKVEPSIYYYLCDTMGLMVLQDMASGAGDRNTRYGFYREELKAMIDELRAFPCIVMWIPYNEGWGQPGEWLTHATLDWVKRYDSTRLVDGPSGWSDYEGGVGFDYVHDHDYHVPSSHKPAGKCEAADVLDRHQYRGPGMFPVNDRRITFLGEFGGLGHAVEGHLWRQAGQSWGYGGTDDTRTREGLEKTYLDLMDRLALLAARGLGGSVYTQTTDVEIEMNGYLTYDRKVCKFDKAVLRAAHQKVETAMRDSWERPCEEIVLFDRYSDGWRYTFAAPGADWMKPGFDASAWPAGRAGFGNKDLVKDHNQGVVHTEWTGSDLWVRKSFTIKDRGKIDAMLCDMFHDEDATVYVNGVEVLSVRGYTTMFQVYPLHLDKIRKILKEGENLLAAHVKQTTGGQYFDASLIIQRRK